MNRINSIKIENVKGKDKLELNFIDLYANKPNLLVALNGFGKSTIAQAFASIKPTKIDLKRDMFYKNDISNMPKVTVDFSGDLAGTYVADISKNDFNSKFDIKVINNAVVAKSAYSTAGADLKIESIIIYNHIPLKTEIAYSLSEISSTLCCESKIFINLKNVLEDIDNLNGLYEIKTFISRAANNKKAKSKIEEFLSTIISNGSANQIKHQISQNSIDKLLSDENIKRVFNTVKIFNFGERLDEIDIVLSSLQIIIWYNKRCSADNNFLKNLISYKFYKFNRKVLDKRLEIFNTTNRVIKTEKQGNKLVVKFFNATSMSNGERDVLVFIAELFCFQITMKHNNALLIIDEVFDYLDGSNLLVAQYYLSNFIDECKKSGKIIFPILFTHLDPETFNNYYFSDKKIHYLIEASVSCLNSDIAKIIQNRDATCDNDFTSKYLLHYTNENVNIPKEIQDLISNDFLTTSNDFRLLTYNEVDKYLNDEKYNPILVSIGIRIKVEEIVFNRIPEDKQAKFLYEHTTIKKLNFAKDYAELEEILFLLQPIYNDTLHLNSNVNSNRCKINGCAIKLYNKAIKNIVKTLFSL